MQFRNREAVKSIQIRKSDNELVLISRRGMTEYEFAPVIGIGYRKAIGIRGLRIFTRPKQLSPKVSTSWLPKWI
jgi:hypothetical protein